MDFIFYVDNFGRERTEHVPSEWTARVLYDLVQNKGYTIQRVEPDV